MRLLQARDAACFGVEATNEVGVVRDLSAKHLDGDLPLGVRVDRAVHDPEWAGRDLSDDPIPTQRLTMQIASWLNEHLDAKGVGVVIEAEHSCMTLRGVQAAGSNTVTSALLGTLRSDPSARAEFLSLARAGS